MKKIFSVLWLLIASLSAEDKPSTPLGALSSSDASYDGNSLVLSGRVVLDHGLGKMTAEEANLEKQEETGKEFPFKMIHLNRDVLVSLKNASELRCDHADFDFSALKGFLFAKENEKVAFIDASKKKKTGEETPLQLLSRSLELNFSKHDLDAKKTEYEIESIVAKNDIEITYANNFILLADHALYRKQVSVNDKTDSKQFQGILTAYPKDNQSQCHLTHEKDRIDADVIDLDILHSKISMLHSKGVLNSSLLSDDSLQEIHFHCDHLTWDNIKNLLTLKGNVAIEDAALGKISSQNAIELEHTLVKGKRTLQSIHATGPSTLVYQDAETSHQHKIICHGNIHLDRDKLQASLDSPLKSGQVLQTEQIYYEEESIAFYADKAILEYAEENGTLHPISFTLKDNVRLFSHDPEKPQSCGIADRLQYSPATRTLILAANPGKKVLFWDDAQGVRVSAREIHITQDPETNERVVKGIGNLRLTFDATEQAMLEKVFAQAEIIKNRSLKGAAMLEESLKSTENLLK